MTPSRTEGEAGGGGLGRTLLGPYAASLRCRAQTQPAPLDRGSSRRIMSLAVPTRVYQDDRSSPISLPASPRVRLQRAPPVQRDPYSLKRRSKIAPVDTPIHIRGLAENVAAGLRAEKHPLAKGISAPDVGGQAFEKPVPASPVGGRPRAFSRKRLSGRASSAAASPTRAWESAADRGPR